MSRALLMLAVLGGCAASGPEPARSVPAARSLSFEANSWGKPLSAWTLESTGRGRYTESTKAGGGNFRDYDLLMFRDYDLVTRSFGMDPADYRRVEALLAPARAHAGADLPCDQKITDQVYGKIGWTGPSGTEEFSFDVGCTSKAATPIYEGISQAQKLVEQLARRGTVVETREVRERRP